MGDMLDRFIENAKGTVASGYYSGGGKYSGQGHSLAKTLAGNGFSLIAEIKHASPSGEYSFDSIDVGKTALQFAGCGADAISVVVEPNIFKGSLENIPVAKQAGLPVLFKDFVICGEQIDAASRLGADAVLLVARVAGRLGLDIGDMIEHAHQRGLEVLLECYDEEEMRMAKGTKADVLGINNRDLMTLKVDIARTEGIMKAASGAGAPVISESGIKSIGDVRRVRRAGVKGVLVGTAIWKSDDISAKIRELTQDG